MKVAIIAPTEIPSRKANTLQVMKMTQAISILGHQVQLLIPEHPGLNKPAGRNWAEIARHYGLRELFPMRWVSSETFFRKYDYAWKSVRWARNWGAEVIYSRLPQAAAMASNLGYATIFEIHDLPQGTMAPILLRLFLRGAGAKKLISISNMLADDLKRTYKNPIMPGLVEVLPDGVDLQRYEDLADPEVCRQELLADLQALNFSSESRFSPKDFTVGYTGHLYPGRGLGLILDLALRFPEVNFLIVGGEPADVTDLMHRVQERKLENITLTGFVPNIDLPRYQAACDVLLMPYQAHVAASSGGDIGRYLSPMKLFEYLACGRAICASNLPVLQEILSSELALLLPPGDVDAWESAIRDLMENRDLRERLASNGKEMAEKYSWEKRAERIFASSTS